VALERKDTGGIKLRGLGKGKVTPRRTLRSRGVIQKWRGGGPKDEGGRRPGKERRWGPESDQSGLGNNNETRGNSGGETIGKSMESWEEKSTPHRGE